VNTIHAFTEPTPERGSPAYLSVIVQPDGRHVVRVRSREVFFVGCQQPAEIEMSPKELAALALDILDHFNVLDLT